MVADLDEHEAVAQEDLGGLLRVALLRGIDHLHAADARLSRELVPQRLHLGGAVFELALPPERADVRHYGRRLLVRLGGRV